MVALVSPRVIVVLELEVTQALAGAVVTVAIVVEIEVAQVLVKTAVTVWPVGEIKVAQMLGSGGVLTPRLRGASRKG